MDAEKILKTLKQMPNFKEELKEKYMQLIAIAINHIEVKLKKNADKNSSVLVVLCAVLVNLWITMEECSNSPTGSFVGNGYRIRKDSKKQFRLAKKLFDHWRAIAANFLVDEGFSFFAVRGNF